MKKPRKAKAKHKQRRSAEKPIAAQANVRAARPLKRSIFHSRMSLFAGGISRAVRGAHGLSAARFDILARRATEFEFASTVSGLQRRARAVAAPYSADDRELAALLFLPFLLFASVMVIGQSVRRVSYDPGSIAFEQPQLQPQPKAPSQDALRKQAIAGVPRSQLKLAEPELALLGAVPQGASLAGITGDELVATPADPLPISPKSVVAPLALLTPGPLLDAADFNGIALPPLPPSELVLREQPEAVSDTVCRPEATPVLASLSVPQASFTPEEFGLRLAKAAEAQVDGFVIYNDKYRAISYPNGDVPTLFGVCTDVIVRAYRALGVDLQPLVQQARVGTGDRNIDHRRTEVLRRFFAAKGESLPISTFAEDYRPGDIVTYHRPQNSGSRSHIAIVSAVTAPSGRLMIVHNRGWGPQLEDGLFVDEITGHYRYTGAGGTRAPQNPEAVRSRADATKPATSKSIVEPASIPKVYGSFAPEIAR